MANYVILPEAEAMYACPGCGEHYEYRDHAQMCCHSVCEGFQCDSCSAVYSEREEAERCCPQVSDAWLCPECWEGYTYESDALACCAPDFDGIEGGKYKCVVDGYAWPTAEEAISCCSYADPEGVEVASMEEHSKTCICSKCKATRAEMAAIGYTTSTTPTTFEISIATSVEAESPKVELTPIQAALASLPREPSVRQSAFS